MAKKNKFSAMTILCIGVLCAGIAFFNLQTKGKIIEDLTSKSDKFLGQCTSALRSSGQAGAHQSCLGQTGFRFGSGGGIEYATSADKFYKGSANNDT